MPELGRHEDARGVIEDILGPVDAVTRITTVKGAVRGNHAHRQTEQWTLVVSGRLLAAYLLEDGQHDAEHGPGDLFHEPAGIPHAWKAIEDTEVIVLTRGPRAGENYESDTIRGWSLLA